MNSDLRWTLSKPDTFWGEVAHDEHVLQIYEDNEIFMDMLAGFVAGGINAGDAVIVIATKEHHSGLIKRLTNDIVTIKTRIARDQYFPIDADDMLSKFMINGMPDENLFIKAVSELLEKAKKNNRKVRAFGEMVALLWAQGHYEATLRLEHLWCKYCENEKLSLFCAYPKKGFTKDGTSFLKDICCSHSKIITGGTNPLQEIYYQNSTLAKAV